MATPAPAPSDALDLDLDLAPWLATLIAAIGAIVPVPPDAALAALQALCRPYAVGGAERSRVEGLSTTHRAAFRDAYNAKWHAIDAARTAAPPVAPTATERQAIPVVQSSTPVLPVPIVRPGKFAPLMVDRSAPTGHRMPSGAERARRGSPEAWGARIEHPATEPLTVGAIVRLTNSRGTSSTLHRVTGIVVTDGQTTVATIERAPADALTPRPVIAPSAPAVMAWHADGSVSQTPLVSADTNEQERRAGLGYGMPEGAIPLSALMPDALPERVIPREAPSTIGGALADVASEGAALAAPRAERVTVEPTERGNGNTTDSGAGIGIFALPAAQRAFRVAEGPKATQTERQRLLSERDLIAGAIAADGWLQVSWTGEGSTTHGVVADALRAIERESDEPGIPSPEHYAGLACDVLRGRDWDVKRLGKNATPAGVKARWLIGRALGGDRAAAPGDAYGTAMLFVDLVMTSADEGALRFEGDTRLADQVRTAYSAAIATFELTSRVLTPWLGRVLRTRHGAVKRGHVWYVPPGHAAAVRALVGAIAPLWGDHETISVTTGPDLFSSLTRGLLVEAQKVAADFAAATVDARERARDKARERAAKHHGASDAYIEREGQAAYDRATISATKAASFLGALGTVAARVSGYESVLGEESTREAKALISSLRATLDGLTDDISIRGALLELDR